MFEEKSMMQGDVLVKTTCENTLKSKMKNVGLPLKIVLIVGSLIVVAMMTGVVEVSVGTNIAS